MTGIDETSSNKSTNVGFRLSSSNDVVTFLSSHENDVRLCPSKSSKNVDMIVKRKPNESIKLEVRFKVNGRPQYPTVESLG